MAGISPIRQGQTSPPSHIKFVDDTGKPVFFPVGTTFTLYIYDSKTNETYAGQGSFTVANFAQGLVDYNWNAADTISRAGNYKLYVAYTFPTGENGFGDEVDLLIKPTFVQQ